MQIKCLYISNRYETILFSYNTTKNSNNVQSVFGFQREDTYCAVLKKSIVNAFNISKEDVRSFHFIKNAFMYSILIKKNQKSAITIRI
jgi:uncharacterized protein with WD repeat